MSKVWCACPECHRWGLHYLLRIKNAVTTTRPRLDPIMADLFATGLGDVARMRWVPGTKTTERRATRECRECGAVWYDVLESSTEDA